MARSSNQKAKLLYLAQLLWKNSDEEHPVTVREMLQFLSQNGISAERKSIYADLETLRLFGLDIIQTRGKTTGYFIGEREFELPELLLLVDAVQSSRFLTLKKSNELIAKLQGLASTHQAKSLAHHVYVTNRIKTMNESIYRNIDRISAAMESDRSIRFSYFEWNSKKEKVLRRGGAPYTVSPLHLTWDNENYYLIAYDEEAGFVKHFRVDKMLGIEGTDHARIGLDAKETDPAVHARKVFGMFGGREESVTLFGEESLAGVFIDRFGKDLVFRTVPGGFEVDLHVEISPVFLSWLVSFGNRVRVISPESVKRELCQLAKSTLSQYSEEE